MTGVEPIWWTPLSSDFEVFHAALPIRLPPEVRRQTVELVRSGCTPKELAREFEPAAQSISTWVKQAEREELTHLRHENHRLRQ